MGNSSMFVQGSLCLLSVFEKKKSLSAAAERVTPLFYRRENTFHLIFNL